MSRPTVVLNKDAKLLCMVLNLQKEKLHLFSCLNSEFSIYSIQVPRAQHILSINVQLQ